MSEPTFDAFTRRAAAAVSRRGSLLGLGGSALAFALVGPDITQAKQGGRKNDTCKKQVSRCKTGLSDLRDTIFPNKARSGVQADGVVLDCFTAFERCCEILSDCNVSQALACAVDVVEALEEEMLRSGRGRIGGMVDAA
jgi:hypothetical protein